MFESRRRAKEQRAAENQRAVSRGWGIVSGYRLELVDDLVERYGVEGSASILEQMAVEVDLRDRTDTLLPFPESRVGASSPSAIAPTAKPVSDEEGSGAIPIVSIDRTPYEDPPAIDGVQERAVEVLHTAIGAWFGFYFRTVNASDVKRREIASRGLKESSRKLIELSKDLGEAANLAPFVVETANKYRVAIEVWAEAFDVLGRGMLLDQQYVADRGMELMRQATEAAGRAGVGGPSRLIPQAVTTLDFLDDLAPPPGASKIATRKAKDPWRAAVVAACTRWEIPARYQSGSAK